MILLLRPFGVVYRVFWSAEKWTLLLVLLWSRFRMCSEYSKILLWYYAISTTPGS